MPNGDIETFHEHGKWHNCIEGRAEVQFTHASRDEAIREGRELADLLKAGHVIKHEDGTIAERHAYRRDSSSSEVGG